jgi:hypothetical protein
MKYNYRVGVIQAKSKAKKYVMGGLGGLILVAGAAVPALASNSGDGSSYGTQPGFTQAQSQTQCSGAGAFGAFGKDYNLGNEQSGHYPGGSYPGPGADGQQTGANNSNLCGSPQGNP